METTNLFHKYKYRCIFSCLPKSVNFTCFSIKKYFNGEMVSYFSTTLDNRAKLMLVIPTKLSLCTRSMKKVTEKVAKEVAKASSEESSNLVPKVAPISSPKFPLPPPHRKGARSPRTTFVPNFIFVDPRVIDDYYATNITHLHIINPLNKYYFLFTGELYTMQQLNELCLSYMYKSKNVVKYEVEKKNKRFYFVIQINSVDNIVQYFKDILARNFQFRSFEQQKNKIRVKLQNNNSFLQQATLRNRYPLINSFPLLTKYFKPTEVKLKTIEPQLTDFELYKKDFEFITNYFIKHKLKFNPFSEDLLPLRKFYIRIEHITLIKVFVKSLKKDLTKAKDKMNDILESHKRYKYRTYEDYDKIDEDHQQSRDHVINYRDNLNLLLANLKALNRLKKDISVSPKNLLKEYIFISKTYQKILKLLLAKLNTISVTHEQT